MIELNKYNYLLNLNVVLEKILRTDYVAPKVVSLKQPEV